MSAHGRLFIVIGIAFWLLLGCGSTHLQHTKDPVSTPSGSAKKAPDPSPAAAHFKVAGCNVECEGCGAIDSETYVVGRAGEEGRVLFDGPTSAGASYSCSNLVSVGEEVVLIPHSSAGFEFARWRLFDATRRSDYCPCVGSTQPECRFVIDEAIARQYERAYCGAVWKLKASSPSAAP